jgi:hypothetical protein
MELTLSDMISLSTVLEPKSIRSRMMVKMAVNRMVITGIARFDSTLLRYRQPGRPRSRANAHVIREEDATKPMVEKKVKQNKMHAIVVATDGPRIVQEYLDESVAVTSF